MRLLPFALTALLLLAGCGSAPTREVPAPAPAPSKGAYYKDDGPGANPPANLAAIPDAIPKAEPLHRFANRPYQVFGRDYVPIAAATPFRQTGIGSWYGRRFHGSPTSSGESYDMYAMTAAHPTLPIPSYARVTNVANGRSVVVRINDRGPFHSDRIIDLSYAAAWKLGYAEAGSARVEVESIVPGGAYTTVAAANPEPAPKQDQGAEAKGVYLQLGAFSAREAAENFRVRLYRDLAWLSEAIQVVAGGAVFRLHLGPYRTQDEARGIADRIQAEFNLRPLLVVR
ncbi:MAG TPA: septal ring lytic transglycosylase RlpA family protein [Burkholderiales bacterium]|nr:septal ring lytic transglycosylase RlpA family protein [Burkholderiales bacterium]